jgi:hypothetical protein
VLTSDFALDLPDIATQLDSAARKSFRSEESWKAISLLLLFGGACAAVVPSRYHTGHIVLSLGPLASGLCFLVTLAISVALAEDRHTEQAGRAASVGQRYQSLAWRYATGGAPFVETYRADVARRLYLESAMALSGAVGRLAPLIDFRSGGQHVTASMDALRAAGLEARRAAYKELRLTPVVAEAKARAALLSRRAKQFRAGLRIFSFLALAAALAEAVDLLSLDLVGAMTVGSTGVLAWTAMQRYDSRAAEATVQFEQAALLVAQLELLRDPDRWGAFVANCEDRLFGPVQLLLDDGRRGQDVG